MPQVAPHPRVVAKLAPLGGKRTRYTFTGIKGLQLDCIPDNTALGKRIWRVRYYVGDTEKIDTLGTFNENDREGYIPLARATELAAERRRLVKVDGVDPRKAVATFAEVYAEWLDNPARPKSLRPRTREEYERIYKLHVEPYIGAAPIGQLEKAKIATVLEKVRRATTDETKGHRGLQATKALKLIRSVCGHAADKDYIQRDPTRGVDNPVPEGNPEGKQHRAPTNDELRAMWSEAHRQLSKTNRRLLQLAILLGKRVSELIAARQNELDDGPEANLFIPGTREGNKSREDQRVPLPPLALSILKEAAADAQDSPFLFPADGLPNQHVDRGTPSHAFTDMRRRLGMGDEVRFHDMRSLIVDQLAALGVPSEYRSHVLQHTSDMRATLGDRVYKTRSTFDHMAEKRRALELWERRLLEIVEGRSASGLRW